MADDITQVVQSLGLVTAYGYAKHGGYEGTEAEFEEDLADAAAGAATATQKAADAADSASSAEDYATYASNYATAASGSATDAAGSATDAADYKTAALSAKNDAVDAKDAAVTAKTNAETAETGASTAKDAAVSAKNDAVSAKNAAVAAKESAEASATTATDKATAAAGSANAAAASAEAAEKWATGGSGGTASETNNAKAYAEDAAASATAAAESAATGPAALANEAPTFEATVAYTAGDYVLYSSTLYRFTADHAAGEWSGTDAVAVQIGQEIEDCKDRTEEVDDNLDSALFIGSLNKGHLRYKKGSVSLTDGTFLSNNYSMVDAELTPIELKTNDIIVHVKSGYKVRGVILDQYKTFSSGITNWITGGIVPALNNKKGYYVLMNVARVDGAAIANSEAAAAGLDTYWIEARLGLEDGVIGEISGLKSSMLPYEEVVTETIKTTETQLSFPDTGRVNVDDGTIATGQTSYSTTDYIDLTGVTGIYRTGTTVQLTLWRYGFYNDSKEFLGAVADTENYQIVTYNGQQVTWLDLSQYPTAKYIRISMVTSRPYTYHSVTATTVSYYDIPPILIDGVKPLKFYGKTIVNFGDSIFGNFRDSNTTTDKSISKMIAEATGATVYNAGFGGCRMAAHSSPWNAFSMYSIADSIAAGDWTVQENALTAGAETLPDYFADTVAMLEYIDFSTVDMVTIGYGTNDYSGNVFINSTDASFTNEWDYFKGALAYSLRTILTAFPKLKIVVITPCWRWFADSSGAFSYDSDDDESENTRHYILPDYVDACKSICATYHVPCIDTYADLGFNEYTIGAYFPVKGVDGYTTSDGVHPKQAGRQLRADRIVGQIEALY